MTSGDGVAVFWEQVVGWGGIPCTARQGAPSARSTSYQQKSATASHRSANSGLWAAHWGVSAPPNMMASEPPTRATCAPAWWAATRPLGRAGCGGVLASGPQQGRSSPSTDCCFSETRLGVPKCPPKHVAHLIKSNTPGAAFDHGNRDAVPAKPAHGADRRPASVARARHGVGRRARHTAPSKAPTASCVALPARTSRAQSPVSAASSTGTHRGHSPLDEVGCSTLRISSLGT